MSKKFKVISFITAYLVNPIAVFANPIHNPAIDPLFGTGGGDDGTGSAPIVARLLARTFSAMLAAGTLLFLGYLVYGAFRWLTAGGDKAAVAAARGTITEALIGLTVLASVFAIANLVAPILGLSGGACQFPQQICWPTL